MAWAARELGHRAVVYLPRGTAPERLENVRALGARGEIVPMGYDDAVRLAEWLNKSGRQPEQVQDFYPTPGTLSTCMYHTGLDPRTMAAVYVPTDAHDKAMQRALMQWKRPEKRPLVLEALRRTHREDLIGYGRECLSRRPGKRRSRGRGGGKIFPRGRNLFRRRGVKNGKKEEMR